MCAPRKAPRYRNVPLICRAVREAEDPRAAGGTPGGLGGLAGAPPRIMPLTFSLDNVSFCGTSGKMPQLKKQYVAENVRIYKYGTQKTGTLYKILEPHHSGCGSAAEHKADALEVRETAGQEGKADSNLSRARNRLKELAMCNDWDYFCTWTLSSEYDRSDLAAWRARFTQCLRNLRRLKGYEIKYILVPERHSDGAWHMHGFLAGVPQEALCPFEAGKHPKKLVQGGYLNWPYISERFGFLSLAPIREAHAAASYCAKYITKDAARNVSDKGAHLYYASRGLNGRELVFCGSAWINGEEELPGDSGNDWWTIRWRKPEKMQGVVPIGDEFSE